MENDTNVECAVNVGARLCYRCKKIPLAFPSEGTVWDGEEFWSDNCRCKDPENKVVLCEECRKRYVCEHCCVDK